MQAPTFADRLNDIKARMKGGLITYEQARNEADPILEAMNARMAEICRQYRRKHRDVTFAGFMR